LIINGEGIVALLQFPPLVGIIQKLYGRKFKADPAYPQLQLKPVRPPVEVSVSQDCQAHDPGLRIIVKPVVVNKQ